MKRLLIFILTAGMILAPLCVREAGAEGLFPDVNEGDWFYENVMAMAEAGYITGYPDGTFGPGNSISGAEFVTIAARMKGLAPKSAQNLHWAGGRLQAALDAGWYDWDELPPTAQNYDEPITRQLAVKILMRAFAPDARGDYAAESAKMADFSLLNGRYYEPVLAAYSLGFVTGDNHGNFNPRSPLSRAEACALLSRAAGSVTAPGQPDEVRPVTPISGGVSENGHLSVIGTQLCNERGEAVVLRGMSSHGIQWFPEFLSESVISSTADRGANLFRVAMYTGEGGYITDPTVKNTLTAAVDRAIALDMYVIIDWHILSDGNPMTHLAEARTFFTEMARRYCGNPAVLYEICNEPNGNVSWSSDVKPYAEDMIRTIREIDDRAIILVGSPTWSQDLHLAAADPIDADNIMYTCHFYAGTHTQWLRDRISAAMEQGLPVFISEWGTSDASGGGGIYPEETRRWLDFLAEKGISWANWSLCDKNESSAAIKPGARISDGISDDELTESGRIVFNAFH